LQVRSWSSDHGAQQNGPSRLSHDGGAADGGKPPADGSTASTPSPDAPALRIDPATPSVSKEGPAPTSSCGPSPVKAQPAADANGDAQHGSGSAAAGSAAAAMAPAIGPARFGALKARLASAQAPQQPDGPGAKPAEFSETPYSSLSPKLQVQARVTSRRAHCEHTVHTEPRVRTDHVSRRHAALFATAACPADTAHAMPLQREFKELHMEGAPALTVKTRSGGPQTPDDSPVAPKVHANVSRRLSGDDQVATYAVDHCKHSLHD